MKRAVTLIGGKIVDLPSYFSHLGVGIFETVPVERVSNGFSLPFLGRHLNRLTGAAGELNTAMPSSEELKQSIQTAVSEYFKQDGKRARLRIISLPAEWIVSVGELSERLTAGVSVGVFEGVRSLPRYKSCSSYLSVLSAEKARRENQYEALLVDRDGVITEGSWSNFFWIDRNGDLVTPGDRCLFGITREIVLELAAQFLNIQIREASLDEILDSALECFLTKSTEGVIPINSIGSKSFHAHQITLKLKELYDQMLDSEPVFTR